MTLCQKFPIFPSPHIYLLLNVPWPLKNSKTVEAQVILRVVGVLLVVVGAAENPASTSHTPVVGVLHSLSWCCYDPKILCFQAHVVLR